MNVKSHSMRPRVALGCALAALLLTGRAEAQFTTNNYIYTGNQTGSPGTNWAGPGVTGYWKLNNAGLTFQPFAGTTTSTTTNFNFFLLNSNGISLGNGTATALIRQPYTAPVPNTVTFPGDALILGTNTQIRFKHGGGTGTLVSGVTFNTPTNNFPGNYGMPGLILNGGCLNTGDSGYAYVINGSIYANPGTTSFLDPADTFAPGSVLRALVINAQLGGSGTLALLNGTNTVPQPIQGVSNTFAGTWVLRSGWLRGNGNGTTDGYNSLGTNAACQYIINPLWQVPNTFAAGSTFFNGPAILDMGASLANCAGSLVLTNGGQMYLHGNVLFQHVTVENYSLPNGTYTYATLAAMFSTANGYANNFSPAGFPAGSGTLTVQPPGPPLIPPSVTAQPVSEILYGGRTASFSGAGNGTQPLYYQWLKNGSPLSNGVTGSGAVVAGATTTNLIISNVSSADNANYSLLISNVISTATSSSASLAVVSTGEPYETAVSNLNPVAFYQLNEATSPFPGPATALDFAGGLNGIYGTNVVDGATGVAGPSSAIGFPGFNGGNRAAQFTPSAPGGRVAVPAWNLNTNSVTLSCWVNPNSPQLNSAGLIYCRGADTVAGLCYSGNTDAGGNFTLGYNWNNDPNAYGWNSGLVPPAGQWSFVTLVVTPASATIYLMNASGLTSATHVYPHSIQAFSSVDTTLLGDDSLDGGNGSRTFNGVLDDVAVFKSALTGDQVASLFYKATGVSSYAPIIGLQPAAAVSAYTGQTVSLNVGADGTSPLSFQWFAAPSGSGGPYTPLSNGPGANGETISGAQAAILTIQNVALGDALDYELLVTNLFGNATSTLATLTVNASTTPQNITLGVQEAAGTDWNTAGQWSDGNPASVSAASSPGSTYEILPGARLRTPLNAITGVFPGSQLSLDGTGVFINNPAAGTLQGELRTKQGVAPNGIATATFPLLIMNGGQFDIGNPGIFDILGAVDIVSNAIFYVDNAGGTGRPIQIDAYLFGTNSIEYHDYDTSMSGGLIIAGTTNTFSGPWNVVQGPLIGTSPGSLGTNSITVGVGAALETSYDLNSPAANLYLNGTLFLHQHDTFRSVVVGSTALLAGTYTAAQLNAAYPATFPTNWTGHYGVTGFTNASGSLTVLASVGATVLQNPTPAAVTLYPSQTVSFTALAGGAPPLYYQWQLNGVNLTDGLNMVGSQSNVLTVVNIPAADAGNYTVVVSNALGHATSAPAVLTLLPTYPAINPISLTTFQAIGADWNTAGAWDDGQGGLAAAVSALQYPGSAYEVPAGMLLRTPAAVVAFTNFPGATLKIDGNGVLINNPPAGSAQGELRFKEGQNQEVVYFPHLIMAGGQIDHGSPTIVDLAGTIEIVSNTPIYVDTAGSQGRLYQIDAQLQGNASIEYHDWDASMVGGLVITCPTNTFTGTWNVVQGPLLGSATNSLGTNSITVGVKGALETLYNLNSPSATLTVNGAVYLHQNDTIYQLAVNGVGIPAGVYSAAQLTAAYPANFPAVWNNLYSSPYSSASGSLTVLHSLILPPVVQSQPATNGAEFVGASMTYSVATTGNQGIYQWFLNGNAIAGATNATYAFGSLPGTSVYACQVSNSAGTATSLQITNLAVDPPTSVTLNDDTNWTVQGTGFAPVMSGGLLELTDNNANETASAFYNIAQYIEGFKASFTYTPGGNLAADGITFCLQNSPAGVSALGGGGGNLGYFGINNSVAFQLNLYAPATGGVGYGFGTNGTIANPYRSVVPVVLNTGNPINVNLYYLPGHLQVKLVDSITSDNFVTNLTVPDFAAILGQSMGYVGFTAADGGSVASQQISNFAFVPAAPPVLVIANTSPTTCTLSWSGGVLTNQVLQASSSLGGPWANVSTIPVLVGNQYQVVITSGGGSQFFRLVSQ